jgi:hypothetical protein
MNNSSYDNNWPNYLAAYLLINNKVEQIELCDENLINKVKTALEELQSLPIEWAKVICTRIIES